MKTIDDLVGRMNNFLKQPYQESQTYRIKIEPGQPTPFEWAVEQLRKTGQSYDWRDIRNKIDDWKELHGYPRNMGMTLDDAGLASHQIYQDEYKAKGVKPLEKLPPRELQQTLSQGLRELSINHQKEYFQSLKNFPSLLASHFHEPFTKGQRASAKENGFPPYDNPYYQEMMEEEVIEFLNLKRSPKLYEEYLKSQEYHINKMCELKADKISHIVPSYSRTEQAQGKSMASKMKQALATLRTQ